MAVFLSACGSTDRVVEVDKELLTFPIVSISTENSKQISSKEEYITCQVSVSNAQTEFCFEDKEAKIKGRGNSTWLMPKKPYKLKFDSKVDLFGNGKAKTWTLIANYCDKSLSRNLMAYSIAREIGFNYTTSTQCVDLFVNDVYQGVYLVCEQIQVDKNRVNISSNLSNVDTGYLIELDSRAPNEGQEGKDYFVIDGYNYAIKDPDVEDEEFTSEHFNFIKDYFTSSYNSLISNDYEIIKNYIDVESFAKCYLVEELFNNIDVGFSSFYFYKDSGGKLCAGPVWDFDISSGNCDYTENGNDYNSLYAKEQNIWFKKLLAYQQFQDLVSDLLESYKDRISLKIDEVANYQRQHAYDNKLNFEAWQILGTYVWPNPSEIVSLKTWEKQLDYLTNWLKKSLNYLSSVYVKESN